MTDPASTARARGPATMAARRLESAGSWPCRHFASPPTTTARSRIIWLATKRPIRAWDECFEVRAALISCATVKIRTSKRRSTPSVASRRLACNQRQLHGKELSTITCSTWKAALSLAQEFDEPAAALIKHTNPAELQRASSSLTPFCAPTKQIQERVWLRHGT